jgi:hypothetical protein
VFPFLRRLTPWSIVLSAVACGAELAEPPTGFAFAAGTPDCGPADGPAVSIYLAGSPVEALEPTAPYARVYVWHAASELEGREWALTGAASEGSAQFVATTGDFEAATAGTLTVVAVRADHTIEGEVDLTFPTVGRVRGGFTAIWLPRTVMCG